MNLQWTKWLKEGEERTGYFRRRFYVGFCRWGWGVEKRYCGEPVMGCGEISRYVGVVRKFGFLKVVAMKCLVKFMGD